MLRIYLNLLGAVTIVVGLAWWPAGIAEYSSIAFQVRKNYTKLIERGIAKDDPNVAGDLVEELQPRIARERLCTAIFLLVLGVSLLVAARRVQQLDTCSALGIAKDEERVV